MKSCDLTKILTAIKGYLDDTMDFPQGINS